MDQIATAATPAANQASPRLTLKTRALPKVHSVPGNPFAWIGSVGAIGRKGASLAVVLCVAGAFAAAVAEAQQPPRARLGAVVATPPEIAREGFPPRQPRGAWITEVQPGSPAEVAGLRPGDLIVAVQGRVITSVRDLVDLLASGAPGDQLRVQYTRDDAFKASLVTLAGPDGIAQQPAPQPPAATAGGEPSLLGGLGSMFSGLLSGQPPNEPAAPAGQAAAEPLPPPKTQTPLEFLSLPPPPTSPPPPAAASPPTPADKPADEAERGADEAAADATERL